MDSVEIRKAVVSDVDQARNLLDQLGCPLPDDNWRTLWVAALGDPVHDILVAEMDGIVVGMIDTVLRLHLHHGGLTATVDSLVVDAARRGQGIGKNLLGRAIDNAASRGARVVELTSGVRRRDSHRFYESQDFVNNGFRFVRGVVPGQ